MPAVTAWEVACGACRRIGLGFRSVAGVVNPDVWRELAFASATSYSLLLPRREAVVDRGTDGFLPVILVHGLGGNRGAWTPLRAFLRLQGHRRLHAFGYEDGTVEEIAAGLVRFVDEVRRVTGEERVDIVAHSLGGIVARVAIQRLGLAERVRTLITLATPHGGTYAAHYANTTLTRPLRPDSLLLASLNADDLAAIPLRLVTIRGDRDVYVIPHDRMTHPQAENILVPGVGHAEHLLSPRVFRLVAGRLSRVEDGA